MTERWLGSIVSIDCGDVLGVYEGQVSKVDTVDQTISLINASRNSEKCVVAEITLSARDIRHLDILRRPDPEVSKISTSIGQTAKSAFVQPSSLAQTNSKSDSPIQDECTKKRGDGKKKVTASKKSDGRKWMTERDEACFSAPVDSSVLETDFDFEKNLALFDKRRVYDEINARSKMDHGTKLIDCNKRSQAKYRCDENILVGDVPVMRQISVPCEVEKEYVTGCRKKQGKASRKLYGGKWTKAQDEVCFSAPVDCSILETDFDFEKNLALFDKKQVYNEINTHSKPDYGTKLIDCNKRSQAKYHCDENVLVGDAPVMRQIFMPCEVEKEYVTDAGLVVPSVTPEYRETLFKRAEEFGLTVERRLEMVGRAASEMVLQLLGGNHRLNPSNSHQRPTVVILCRPHIQGAQGLTCGRHLSNHNVNVTVLFPPKSQNTNAWFEQELKLFSLSGGKTTSSIFSLPNTVDIIIGCLDNLDGNFPGDSGWLENTVQWANQCKAPLLSLDPPPHCGSLEQKWILSPALPFYFPNDKCSVYICDIGLPKDIFSSVDSTYTSPFGSKFVIPLYVKAD